MKKAQQIPNCNLCSVVLKAGGSSHGRNFIVKCGGDSLV